MKRAIKILLALLGTVCFSCKNDKPLNTGVPEKEVKLHLPMNEQLEDPLSEGLLWVGLPDKVGDLNKISVPGSIVEEGLHQVKARYQDKNEDEKYIDLELTDGHGPMALAIKNTILLKLSKEFMETTADGYTKVYIRNGNKVYESQRKYNQTGIIEYIADQRFCISIKGSNLTVKDLWNFADNLNYKETLNTKHSY